MVKNKFLKYSLMLITVSCISKVLALIIKIVEARILDFKIISLISLLFPTYNILITLSLFGTPLATQILVAKNKLNSKNVLITNIFLSLILSLLIAIIIAIISNPYTSIVLKEKRIRKAFLSIILILPFISISSNIKGYLNGKNRYNITSFSSIIEYIIKLIITFTIFPILNKLDTEKSILIIFLLNIIYEIASIIFMSLFMNKEKGYINKKVLDEDRIITIPFTLKELINSLSMFLEPIIITNLYSKSVKMKYLYMINYNTPLLLAPCFITTSISSLIITSLSKCSIDKSKEFIKKISFVILVFSIVYLIILTKFDKRLVYLIFKVNGPSFIKDFPITFILLYLEGVYQIVFDSISKSKINLFLSILSCFVRTMSLILLSFTSLGIKAYIYSLNINIVITFIFQILFLRKIFFSH